LRQLQWLSFLLCSQWSHPLVPFESGGGVNHSTAGKIEEAFTKEGVTFVYEDDTRGPGILLPKELSRRIGKPVGTCAKGKLTKRSTKRN
jgi:hypothetical protein